MHQKYKQYEEWHSVASKQIKVLKIDNRYCSLTHLLANIQQNGLFKLSVHCCMVRGIKKFQSVTIYIDLEPFLFFVLKFYKTSFIFITNKMKK